MDKVGIFGGSFDPVHVGHLAMAHHARNVLGLDEVWFIPATQNPLKRNAPRASDDHRMAMLDLATKEETFFNVLDLEFGLPQPSYTAQTIAVLLERFPQTAYYLIIGSDQLPTLHLWKDISILGEKVDWIVLRRDGFKGESSVEGLRIHWVDNACVDVSSTQIREHLAQGYIPFTDLPEGVGDYIQKHNLYSENL